MSSKPALNKLVVRNKNPGSVSVGANTEVLLNGQPVEGLTDLKIHIAAGDVARVTFELVTDLDCIELGLDDVQRVGKYEKGI